MDTQQETDPPVQAGSMGQPYRLVTKSSNRSRLRGQGLGRGQGDEPEVVGMGRKRGLEGKMRALLSTNGSSPSGEDGDGAGCFLRTWSPDSHHPHLKDHTQCVVMLLIIHNHDPYR